MSGRGVDGGAGSAGDRPADRGSADRGRVDAARLAERIRAADTVVALTGAGISVPSGIPDFRSPGTGLWERVDPFEVAHIDVWRRDPVRFWAFYGHRFHALRDKRPNRAHEILVELERRGLLRAVITQNIDRLHERAGSGAARAGGAEPAAADAAVRSDRAADATERAPVGGELIELHGTIAHSSCLACGARYPLATVQARIDEDPQGVPRCDCGRPLKPDVVLFGEMLPEAALMRAQELAAAADLLVCIGTSLEVYPVAELPAVTLQAGGELALITQGPTRFDADATVKLDGDVVDELEAVLAAL